MSIGLRTWGKPGKESCTLIRGLAQQIYRSTHSTPTRSLLRCGNSEDGPGFLNQEVRVAAYSFHTTAGIRGENLLSKTVFLRVTWDE